MAKEHAVALASPGDDRHNTIVWGVDIVVPLEADLDGDPLQDDQVRLSAIDGSYDQTLHAQAEEVELHDEKPLLLYRFRDVPRGAYQVAVKIADDWVVIVPEVVVKKDGAFVGGKAVTGTIDDIKVGHALNDGGSDDGDGEQPDYDFRDQPEEMMSDG